MSLTVRQVASAEQFDPSEWRTLAGTECLFLSLPSIRMAEANPAYQFTYLVAYEREHMVGVLPVYVSHGAGNELYDPPKVYLGDVDEAQDWYPLLLAGSRAGFVNDLLLGRHLTQSKRRAVARTLFDALAGLKANLGARAIALMYVRDHALEEVVDAVGLGAQTLWAAVGLRLDVRWASIEAYVASLSRNGRSTARRELRAFANAGYRVRVESLDAGLEEALPLLGSNLRKYGHAADEHRQADQLAAFAREMGEATGLITCRRKGKLVACLHCTEWENVLYSQQGGFAYDRDGRYGEYFNLLIYLPLRRAIERGLSAVDLSILSCRAKLRRGAEPETRWAVVVGPDGADADWQDRAHARSRVMRNAYEHELYAAKGSRIVARTGTEES